MRVSVRRMVPQYHVPPERVTSSCSAAWPAPVRGGAPHPEMTASRLPHLQVRPRGVVTLCKDGRDMLFETSQFRAARMSPSARARAAIELDRDTSAATLKIIRSSHPLESEATVLPPFIIEQIRRREEEERRRDQPRLELPVDAYPPRSQDPGVEEVDEERPERGVVILDL